MAIQRTIFACERTLIAYLHTAIAVITDGFAVLKLSQHLYMEVMGILLMPIGLSLAIYSFYRYRQKQKLIKQQLDAYTPAKTTPNCTKRKYPGMTTSTKTALPILAQAKPIAADLC
jgi:uncharacterized membrane protein YidH (DUF202 family)